MKMFGVGFLTSYRSVAHVYLGADGSTQVWYENVPVAQPISIPLNPPEVAAVEDLAVLAGRYAEATGLGVATTWDILMHVLNGGEHV